MSDPSSPKVAQPTKRYHFDDVVLSFWAGVMAGSMLFACLAHYVVSHGGCK